MQSASMRVLLAFIECTCTVKLGLGLGLLHIIIIIMLSLATMTSSSYLISAVCRLPVSVAVSY